MVCLPKKISNDADIKKTQKRLADGFNSICLNTSIIPIYAYSNSEVGKVIKLGEYTSFHRFTYIFDNSFMCNY